MSDELKDECSKLGCKILQIKELAKELDAE
jgi:hypothetical protein